MKSSLKKKMTEQEMLEWEAKDSHNRKVRSVEFTIGDEDDMIPDGDKEKATFFIVPPSRPVVNLIAKHVKKDDLDKGNRACIVNCVLAGDMEYITDGSDKYDQDVYFGLLEAIGEGVAKKKGIIKKR